MDIVQPDVRLIASTTVYDTPELERDSWATDAEHLIEFAGRSCYQSFHRPNPETRANMDYIQRTVKEQKHWSIAEHASATFYLTGVSRAFTHELIRHRHLSYSQLSQRFVDEREAGIVLPPAMEKAPEIGDALQSAMHSSEKYTSLVKQLEGRGLPRKQAREAARAVLPNMVETRIVVTGNLRAWHEFCERRMQPDADAEMQSIAKRIFVRLNTVSPALFPLDEIPEDEE